VVFLGQYLFVVLKTATEQIATELFIKGSCEN